MLSIALLARWMCEMSDLKSRRFSYIATFLAVLFGCSAQQRLEMQHWKRVDGQRLIFPPGFLLALSYFTTLNKTMKKYLCAVQQGG